MSEFIIDETQIKVGQDYFWIWVVIDSTNKTVLGIHISSLERNMLIAEEFLHSMINKYGKHPISTDGGTWYHSSSLQILENKTSLTFIISEKYH